MIQDDLTYVSWFDSRSEAELYLWSLQCHTELGGTVPCTSAGLKAPKQVSGSRYRWLQRQSWFPLLTINAAVLNAKWYTSSLAQNVVVLACICILEIPCFLRMLLYFRYSAFHIACINDENVVVICSAETEISDGLTLLRASFQFGLQF